MKVLIKNNLVPLLMMTFLTLLMVFLSEVIGEKEIIFPEIAAIGIGAILAPKQSWNVSPSLMIGSIAFMALVGTSIVRYLSFPYFVSIILALIIAVFVIAFVGMGFVPAISAGVLPVVLNCGSWVYPLSATLMTSLICLMRFFLVRKGFREKRPFIRAPFTTDKLVFWIKNVVVISLIIAFAVFSENIFLAVPPLIVAYIEMANVDSPLRKKPLNAIVLISSASIIGVSARLLLVESLNMTLTFATAIVLLLLTTMLFGLHMFMPPAGAIAVLPMLLSADGLLYYPLEVTLSFALMTILALLINRPNPLFEKSKANG